MSKVLTIMPAPPLIMYSKYTKRHMNKTKVEKLKIGVSCISINNISIMSSPLDLLPTPIIEVISSRTDKGPINMNNLSQQ